jgi:hypothetical protein
LIAAGAYARATSVQRNVIPAEAGIQSAVTLICFK